MVNENILVLDEVNEQLVNSMVGLGYGMDLKPGLSKDEVSGIINDYDAVIVRSKKLNGIDIGGKVRAIGRAGAGVNNIDHAELASVPVVVFNAPGANSNAVVELAETMMGVTARNVVQAARWAREELPGLYELGKEKELATGGDASNVTLDAIANQNKKYFKGTELFGKTAGIIGLGQIGYRLANRLVGKGMNVLGYDPCIADQCKADINNTVKQVDLDELLDKSDYISLHAPQIEATTGMINGLAFSKMKKGVVLLNFAREPLIHEPSLYDALEGGKVKRLVTDFQYESVAHMENVIALPHLGASTNEAGINCAVMIGRQLHSFLAHGNIKNSVNYPAVEREPNGGTRIAVYNRNIPGMLGKINTFIGKNYNISKQVNASRGDLAYTLFDVDGTVDQKIYSKLEKVKGVIAARHVYGP